jgi:hypothetical protein
MAINVLGYDSSLLTYTPDLLVHPEYGHDVIYYDVWNSSDGSTPAFTATVYMKWGGYDVSTFYCTYYDAIFNWWGEIDGYTLVNEHETFHIYNQNEHFFVTPGFSIAHSYPTFIYAGSYYGTREYPDTYSSYISNMFLMTSWESTYSIFSQNSTTSHTYVSPLKNLHISPGCVFIELLIHQGTPGNGGFTQAINIDTHKQWTRLSMLAVPNNNLTQLNSFKEWVNINHIEIEGNPITSFRTFPEWTNLSVFNANYTLITDVSVYSTWQNITSFNMRNTPLTQNSIDNILINMDLTELEGTRFINLSGCSAPSSNGYAAKDSLIAKGWTVTTS